MQRPADIQGLAVRWRRVRARCQPAMDASHRAALANRQRCAERVCAVSSVRSAHACRSAATGRTRRPPAVASCCAPHLCQCDHERRVHPCSHSATASQQAEACAPREGRVIMRQRSLPCTLPHSLMPRPREVGHTRPHAAAVSAACQASFCRLHSPCGRAACLKQCASTGGLQWPGAVKGDLCCHAVAERGRQSSADGAADGVLLAARTRCTRLQAWRGAACC